MGYLDFFLTSPSISAIIVVVLVPFVFALILFKSCSLARFLMGLMSSNLELLKLPLVERLEMFPLTSL
jgi:hypothetical protein